MGAVFLDLDGTLTDSGPQIMAAADHALRGEGIELSRDQLLALVGPPMIDSFGALGVSDPHAALERYRDRYSARMLDVAVYDGVHDALAVMAEQGHRLYLMTAKPHVQARQITAHHGLSVHLLREYGPELDGRFNDKAELLAHALRETGERPEASVMVGDRANDLRAGRATGMAVIAALWGYGGAEEMAAADVLLAHAGELPAAVAGLL